MSAFKVNWFYYHEGCDCLTDNVGCKPDLLVLILPLRWQEIFCMRIGFWRFHFWSMKVAITWRITSRHVDDTSRRLHGPLKRAVQVQPTNDKSSFTITAHNVSKNHHWRQPVGNLLWHAPYLDTEFARPKNIKSMHTTRSANISNTFHRMVHSLSQKLSELNWGSKWI